MMKVHLKVHERPSFSGLDTEHVGEKREGEGLPSAGYALAFTRVAVFSLHATNMAMERTKPGYCLCFRAISCFKNARNKSPAGLKSVRANPRSIILKNAWCMLEARFDHPAPRKDWMGWMDG